MKENKSAAVLGVALVVFGLGLLGTQLGVSIGIELDARTARFWPMLLLGAGALFVVTSSGRRGWGLAFLGGVLLMHTLDVVPLTQSWPLFIVSAGVSMMVRPRGATSRAEGGKS